eukprot:580662-Pyramimonas_sp.AAC.1
MQEPFQNHLLPHCSRVYPDAVLTTSTGSTGRDGLTIEASPAYDRIQPNLLCFVQEGSLPRAGPRRRMASPRAKGP